MIVLHHACTWAYTGFRWALVALVLVGAVPMLAASYQYLLVDAAFPAEPLPGRARRTSRAPPS